ncbi:MAG: serine hydrolase domain-containing protein [Candidatus Stygibacter australis]|nr:serine hydrolase domain-containing protein [Candidatus Stygibacter australis]MDP8321223.1 serine hydrolase domain-containing protein [Candidatus Stygibacter australis]
MDILKKLINELLKEWQGGNSPGFAISIISKKSYFDSYYYGCASLEHSIPIDQDTIFYLCSLSKQLTAACLAFLIEENKISLSNPLRKFFPELPAGVYDPINIGHLVHMTSGIHEWYDMMEFSGSYNDEYPWRKSIISLLARQKKLSFTPGDRFSYCNTNYSLVTLIIEMITSKSLTEFARQMIFEPLNMNSTFFCEDNSRVIPHLAAGYYRIANTNKIADKLPPLIGAGGVYSNLPDMTTWLQTILNQKWQPYIFKTLFEPNLLNNGKPNPYLMGFKNHYYHDHFILDHGGAVPGFFTHISYLPHQNCGFVWLANHSNFKPDQFTNALLSYLETEFKPVNNSIGNSIPQLDDPAKYSGNYIYLDDEKSLTLTAENSYLHIEGNPNEFQQQQDNVFVNVNDNSNFIIIEEYHQLVILRIISENDDKFLLKTLNLPRLKDYKQFFGSYYSPELDVTYSLTYCKDKLYIDAVKRFSGTDLILIASDVFLSPIKGFKLRFQRNNKQKIISFILDSSRSQNFTFHKILGTNF